MSTPASAEAPFDLTSYILGHVQNSTTWHPPLFPGLELPWGITVHSLMLVICAFFLIILFTILYQQKAKVPTGITNLLETFVVFIRDEIAISNLGEEDGRKFTPLFCTFFFFILGLNLIGLIPLFSTATANISVTAALAFVTFYCMTIGAMIKNGVGGFFGAFIIHDLPLPLKIFLFLIELIGVFLKTFALAIRLFANMLAGHMVIFALVGLVGMFGYVALPSIFLAIGISLLEVLVAFLQAYIFTLLSAVFIGQIYHPQH